MPEIPLRDDAPKFPLRIPGSKTLIKITDAALALMLLGILVPPAIYAFKLRDPSPTDLLVAICITLFSGVVFLWIMDATDVLRFRAEWISKSVYGAAIVSVLGTSVGVYRGFFMSNPHPYEGYWELTVSQPHLNKLLLQAPVALAFSETAGKYWGYSEFTPAKGSQTDKPVWAEVLEFLPEGHLSVRLLSQDGTETLVDTNLAVVRKEKLLKSGNSEVYSVELSKGK